MLYAPPPPPDFPRGQLRGRAYRADTLSPLASVYICVQPAQGGAGLPDWLTGLGSTDEEGNFDFPDVPAGVYYVFATVTGYVSPATLVPQATWFGPPCYHDRPAGILEATIPKAHIRPDAPCVMDLPFDPGGSVFGSITWQDGSPAKHRRVEILYYNADGEPRDFSLWALTSLEGRYYFDGLPAGKYVVGVDVPRFLPYTRESDYPDRGPARINCLSTLYWTGETASVREAVPVEVRLGSTTHGVDLVLPMLEQEPAICFVDS